MMLYTLYKKRNEFPVLAGVCFLFSFFLFFLSIKGATSFTSDGGDSAINLEIYYFPIIAQIRENGLVPATLLLLSFLFIPINTLSVPAERFKLIFSTEFLYVSAMIMVYIRLSLSPEYSPLKPIAAMVFIVAIFMAIIKINSINIVSNKVETGVVNGSSFAIQLFSLFFISANFFAYLTGQGSVGLESRFYGLTTHPNFLSTITAISVVILLMTFNLIKNIKVQVLYLLIAAAGIWLILISGSRTGLLMLILGLCFIIYFLPKSAITRVLIFIAITSMVCVFGIIDGFASSSFSISPTTSWAERILYAGNTRDVAFQLMIDAFVSNPLTGSGYEHGSSENSTLKIAAISGIIPLIVFMVSIIKMLCNCIYGLCSKNKTIELFSIIGLMLIIGAQFEGFLVEQAGIMGVFYIISAMQLKGESDN